jgi:hypothetical protein
VACWASLVLTVAMVATSIVYALRGQWFLGHQPGGDFVAFYAAGRILNEYPHERLYDLSLQYRIHHAVLPQMPRELVDPYVNTPFTALLFQPLARLPFFWAYGLWMAISAALYVGGLVLLWPEHSRFGGVSRMALLICISFPPFAIECVAGGQISVLGFFALALCTRWQRCGHPVAAGTALAVCLYKPPLLVLAVPMLLIGVRLRALLGFAAGACALGALSLATVGYSGCAGYLEALRIRAGETAHNPSPLPLFKFVDVRSFFQLLLNGDPQVGGGIALILAAAAFVYLAKRWVRSRPGTQADGLLWAATIAWTLVFNLYVPIYDTTLIVISALLMAGAVYGARGEHAESGRSAFLGWMLVLYVTACVSQFLASFARFQILTLVLAAIGFLALRLSRQAEAASA